MTTARTIGLACVLLLSCAASGCQSGSRGANAGSESIFDFVAPPTPAEAAAMAADPYNADNRFRGLLLLQNASFGGADVLVEAYERGLADEDSAVRGVAVRALSRHGGPEHVPLILDLLDGADGEPQLRFEIARALQRLHNPVAVSDLLFLIDPDNERDPAVRSEAAVALGQYPERRVLDGLIAALDDDDLSVEVAAHDSLRTLTGENLDRNPEAWLAYTRDEADPFEGQRVFLYPVFHRGRRWHEYFLFWRSPPNEVASVPAGYVPRLPEAR